MKKLIICLLTILYLQIPVFSADWVEIFEKQYLDTSTVEYNEKTHIVKFWVKSLRKNPKDKILNKDYWYSINKWAIDLRNRKSRIESLNVYDLKNQRILAEDYTPDWNEIVPETYAESCYKLFYQIYECKINP